ncbi:MAG: dissimilatory sulfite reductase D family protein [Deltaproteobacteria bacterium]|nr:dissimilatory sulfite reductase D family protein [Deltaproteobacteria bacterium]
MTEEEAKKLILETLQGKSKAKSKFYLKDFYAMIPDMKNREVKNIVNRMVSEGLLEYWSSGSTTLIGLKGMGKQHGEEDEA